mgnify:CR=1 FL=1
MYVPEFHGMRIADRPPPSRVKSITVNSPGIYS